MPRGGARSGRPGQSYSNRTDLNAAPHLAPVAPTNQPYGTAGSQIAAQQALPMAAPPTPMSSPTLRPSEPVQSGLSTGPGVGPEAIPSINPNLPDPDLIRYAPYLPALELMTTLPNTSAATRNFVRRLRGAMPPQ